jgi:hypothetical protein
MGVNLSTAARKAFDVGLLALSSGLRVGCTYFDQRYEGDRVAPARRLLAPHLDALLRSDIYVAGGVFVGLETALRVRVVRLKTGLSSSESRALVDGVLTLGIGKLW